MIITPSIQDVSDRVEISNCEYIRSITFMRLPNHHPMECVSDCLWISNLYEVVPCAKQSHPAEFRNSFFTRLSEIEIAVHKFYALFRSSIANGIMPFLQMLWPIVWQQLLVILYSDIENLEACQWWWFVICCIYVHTLFICMFFRINTILIPASTHQ